MRVTSKGKVKRVYGALLGQKIGKKVEIFSAFEFVNQSTNEKTIDLDMAYIDTRRELATQLFPKLDIVGFFSTNKSTSPTEIDTQMIKAMTYFGVLTPIYIILSTEVEKSKELPIEAYEADKTTKTLTKVNHIIEGWESERICLDNIIKSSDIQNDESGFIKNYKTTKSALNVLKDNLSLICSSIHNPKFNKDAKFKAMLDDLIINYPAIEGSEYPELIDEKEKEIFVLNNICASSLGKSLEGKGILKAQSIIKENDDNRNEDMQMHYFDNENIDEYA